MQPDRSREREGTAARSYTAEERRAVRRAHAQGDALLCPLCRAALDGRPVAHHPSVSYVRRRVLVTCPTCHAHMVLDDSEDGPS